MTAKLSEQIELEACKEESDWKAWMLCGFRLLAFEWLFYTVKLP